MNKIDEIDDFTLGTIFLNSMEELCIVIYRDDVFMQIYNFKSHNKSARQPLDLSLSLSSAGFCWSNVIRKFTIIAKAEPQ